MTLQPPAFVSSRLVAATSHPIRLQAMTVLVEEPATPSQIAARIGEPVNNVSYHIKVLVELGCVQLVRVQPAGGGRVAERVYEATQRPILDDEDWKTLNESEKLRFRTETLRLISDDIGAAMATGTFAQDDDNHLSRMPMALDQDGWDEVVALLADTLDELFAIQERVDARTNDASERPHHSKVNIIHFRSPTPRSA
jgi:DNA-binding transcriptional ArsR family regulator